MTENSRKSGVLLPIVSLPGGDLGQSARAFGDRLEECGQRVWQLLPLNIPDAFGSPYASLSAFAGDPMQIDAEGLFSCGLLAGKRARGMLTELREAHTRAAERTARKKLLREAYASFRGCGTVTAYDRFCRTESYWLRDFALFDAVRAEEEMRPLWQWRNISLRRRERDAVAAAEERLAEEIGYRCFLQYVFQGGLDALRTYLAARDITLMGDIPLYVAADSADVWAHPELFSVTEERRVRLAAGVPPDCFSESGQLWGNPVYDWDAARAENYSWWRHRLRRVGQMYGSTRIDHFRGLDSFYTVPMPARDARGGAWMQGPGRSFFDAMHATLQNMHAVAEDLGEMSESVHALRRYAGIPGMRVLQFAFGEGADNPFLPHNYERDTVAYLGTHDNNTTLGWWRRAPAAVRAHAAAYLGFSPRTAGAEVVRHMMRALSASVADTVIFTLPDIRSEGSASRLNTPGVPAKSWQYRATEPLISDAAADFLRENTKLHGRWGKSDD